MRVLLIRKLRLITNEIWAGGVKLRINEVKETFVKNDQKVYLLVSIDNEMLFLKFVTNQNHLRFY